MEQECQKVQCQHNLGQILFPMAEVVLKVVSIIQQNDGKQDSNQNQFLSKLELLFKQNIMRHLDWILILCGVIVSKTKKIHRKTLQKIAGKHQ